MVERSAARLDDVFNAVADPTRRAILATLARGETNVGDLAARFPLSLNGFQARPGAGARRPRRAGCPRTRALLEARRAPLEQAADWIDHYRVPGTRAGRARRIGRAHPPAGEHDPCPGLRALVIRRPLPASRADVFATDRPASLGQWMCPPGVTCTTAELDARGSAAAIASSCTARRRITTIMANIHRRSAIEAVVHLISEGPTCNRRS